MKLGISIRIDVTKIEKERIFEGKKGKYLDLTTFIDLDNEDEYGNNGFISQSVSKEEREQGVTTQTLGNTRVFYSDDKRPQQNAPQQSGGQDYDQEIPFSSYMKFNEYAI